MGRFFSNRTRTFTHINQSHRENSNRHNPFRHFNVAVPVYREQGFFLLCSVYLYVKMRAISFAPYKYPRITPPNPPFNEGAANSFSTSGWLSRNSGRTVIPMVILAELFLKLCRYTIIKQTIKQQNWVASILFPLRGVPQQWKC